MANTLGVNFREIMARKRRFVNPRVSAETNNSIPINAYISVETDISAENFKLPTMQKPETTKNPSQTLQNDDEEVTSNSVRNCSFRENFGHRKGLKWPKLL